MSAPHGGGPGPSDAARAAQERLTEEARATASALLDWLGTRIDRGGAPGEGAPPGRGDPRPAQSSGPCTWCPVCALVAALRGEQPELTVRLAEQASGLMGLLRLMVQAHQDPGHAHHHHGWPAGEPEPDPRPAASPAAAPPPPPGWPAEWGAWDAWGTAPTATTAEPPAEPAAAGPEAEIADGGGTSPTGASADGTGAGGRRPPVRRASPRSAAFRGQGVPGPGPADGSTGARVPTTRHGGDGADRSAPVGHAATPPATGSERPTVQRIAIRRPPSSDRSAGPDGDPAC